MATLNLGRIKPVFRGAYAGGTAYVIDDIVTSGGETFICIQASTGNATSSTSHWTKLAEKGTNGTNGTDVGTTLTTQGDILYRDGSGLQRLPKGTANQVLRMNSGATAPEYGTVSSDYVKIASGNHSGANLTLDNIFTADYTHYKFYLYNACMNGDSSFLRFQLRYGGASGATSNASEYRYVTDMWYRNSSSRSSTGEHAWNDSSVRIGWKGSPNSEKPQHVEMYLDDPYSSTTKFMATGVHGHLTNGDVAFANFAASNDTAVSTRWTGLVWYVNSGNSWTGKYAVYGMKI